MLVYSCVFQFADENQNKDCSKQLQNFRELAQKNDYATRKEIKSALDLHTTAGKLLNDRIYQQTGILISPRWKRQDNRMKYFDSVLNIQYEKCEYGIRYYAGMSGSDLQDKICRACPIRSIETEDGVIENMEAFLSLLDVQFVRNEQCTVLPFPFKYLREWSIIN